VSSEFQSDCKIICTALQRSQSVKVKKGKLSPAPADGKCRKHSSAGCYGKKRVVG
jgi:hypothetical protein